MKTIVVLYLTLWLTSCQPQIGFPSDISLSDPNNMRSPQELLAMFSGDTSQLFQQSSNQRSAIQERTSSGDTLSDPQSNLTQQQLLARFSQREAGDSQDASAQEVQRTISAEMSTQSQMATMAQTAQPSGPQTLTAESRTAQPSGPQTLTADSRIAQPMQASYFFNWFSCFFKRGLTWRKKSHTCATGLDLVGCVNCNPYQGDTQCYQRRPILCIYRAQDVRPSYPVTNPFYEGWSGGHIKITQPIRGCYIFSKAHADFICRTEFGNGWGIASHHDGHYIWGMNGMNFAYGSWNWGAANEGGWNFYAYGNISTTPYNSYWTYIRNQPGNCWN